MVASARQNLRALCPPPLRRWREMRYFLRNGEVELHIVPILCRRDRDAIDVGANEGAYLHVMIPNARRVLAIEPIPSLAAALVRKFGRRVAVTQAALSRAAGTSVLRIPMVMGAAVEGLATLSAASPASHERYREIAVTTHRLDEIYSGVVGFIKIDVEGHEEAVLDGAAETIARCRPRLLVEMEERFAPGVIRREHERLRRIGYRGFYIHRRALNPIADFDPQLLQRAEDIDGFTGSVPRMMLDGYVNNFVFLPEEDCSAVMPRIAGTLACGR
ncbi:MAG TPA: FkbM family methyltransferase [Stellaceae bacterium]|nr:FkbM family methyltransferase [Stellaceae bacterium]